MSTSVFRPGSSPSIATLARHHFRHIRLRHFGLRRLHRLTAGRRGHRSKSHPAPRSAA